VFVRLGLKSLPRTKKRERKKERKGKERKAVRKKETLAYYEEIVNYAFKKFYNIGLRIQGGFQPKERLGPQPNRVGTD
jgi:hypothetical protein